MRKKSIKEKAPQISGTSYPKPAKEVLKENVEVSDNLEMAKQEALANHAKAQE